jgi:hypothetical protein
MFSCVIFFLSLNSVYGFFGNKKADITTIGFDEGWEGIFPDLTNFNISTIEPPEIKILYFHISGYLIIYVNIFAKNFILPILNSVLKIKLLFTTIKNILINDYI